jgi:hypothetical protein
MRMPNAGAGVVGILHSVILSVKWEGLGPPILLSTFSFSASSPLAFLFAAVKRAFAIDPPGARIADGVFHRLDIGR